MLHKGEGLNYLTEGRNKSHITLNLREPEGRELLKGLVSRADILIETFLPGVMDDWGIGYEQLKVINPRLIFASITANGQFGPLSRSRMPDYDNIAQARARASRKPPEKSCPRDPRWRIAPGRTDQGRPLDRLGAPAPSWPPVSWPHSTGERPAERTSAGRIHSRGLREFDDNCPVWYHGSGVIAKRFGSLDKGAWLYCFSSDQGRGGVPGRVAP